MLLLESPGQPKFFLLHGDLFILPLSDGFELQRDSFQLIAELLALELIGIHVYLKTLILFPQLVVVVMVLVAFTVPHRLEFRGKSFILFQCDLVLLV